MKYIYLITVSFLVLTACKKKEITYGDFDVYGGDKALLKINYASAFAVSKTVQFKLNGQRYGALISYRNPYPGGGYNTGGASSPEYMQIEPGAYDFSISVPNAGTTNDSIALYSGKITLETGKNYTLHIADTAANTKHLLLVDDVSKPAAGFAKYKFINLIPDAPAVNLYYGDSLVAGNIKYLQHTEYFQFNVPRTSLSWAVRPTDSSATSNPIANYISTNTIVNQRVYTIFSLGYRSMASASAASHPLNRFFAAQRPYVSFFLER